MDDNIRSRSFDRRERRRFKMQLPLAITWVGSSRSRLAGFTLDICSHGVLFACKRHPEVGGSIEYLIQMQGTGPQAVKLRCAGQVLRADPMTSDQDQPLPEYRVAATLERYQFERNAGPRERGIPPWRGLAGAHAHGPIPLEEPAQ